MLLYPYTEKYLIDSGIKNILTHPLNKAIRDSWEELRYIEYFLENLIDRPKAKSKIRLALKQIPLGKNLNTSDHHWNSFMSEFTAFWILEAKLGYIIKEFDAKSPNRIGNKNCDALSYSDEGLLYIDIKAKQDWTRFSPPRSIIELLENDRAFHYSVSVYKQDLKADDELIQHLKRELIYCKEYLVGSQDDVNCDINSLDNHHPHDLTITVRKVSKKRLHGVDIWFPVGEENFGEWMKSQIKECMLKGANIIMLNYIFWISMGEEKELIDFLKDELPDLKIECGTNKLLLKNSDSMRKVIVFMPSGKFETIELKKTT
jgi:hypothetical protein